MTGLRFSGRRADRRTQGAERHALRRWSGTPLGGIINIESKRPNDKLGGFVAMRAGSYVVIAGPFLRALLVFPKFI